MRPEEFPSDLDAECSLLGAVILRPTIMNDLVGSLHVMDFHKPSHQFIYEAMQTLHGGGRAIDPVTVADELRRMGHLDNIGGVASIAELTSSTPSISNFARYADVIIECSRRRRLIFNLSEVVDSAWDRSADIDELIKQAEAINADDLVASRSADIQGLYSIGEFAEIARLSLINDDQPWLIPGITKPRWRTMIVAQEGIGKAVLMRFLAIHAAAGRDPWAPRTFIEPRRVLYVDTENPAETIMHQLQIANRIHDMNLIAEAGDNFHIWHREGGMNLRDRRPQAEFEAVLQRTRPEIVFIGPMYKCYRRSRNEDMEQAALEFTEVIDAFRVRYNFAIVLEHHAPKASSGAFREMNPFGSSLFLRWPELGITMEMDGGEGMTDDRYELTIGRFRRDRVKNDWPQKIERNPRSQLAWSGYWRDGRGRRLEES